MGRKSISQQLDRAKTAETRKTILTNWSKAWELETMNLIFRLERAIQSNDYDELCIATGQLKAVAKKHFIALPKVLTRYTEERPG